MLNQKESKNFNQLTKDYSAHDIALMMEGHFECDACGIKNRCPVGKEYDEMEKYGWWKTPINSCVEVLENYIKTGMIRDKRKERKEEEA